MRLKSRINYSENTIAQWHKASNTFVFKEFNLFSPLLFVLFQHKPPFEVNDLFEDIKDGVKLLALLEVLSGQRLVSDAISADYPFVKPLHSAQEQLARVSLQCLFNAEVMGSFLLLINLSYFPAAMRTGPPTQKDPLGVQHRHSS